MTQQRMNFHPGFHPVDFSSASRDEIIGRFTSLSAESEFILHDLAPLEWLSSQKKPSVQYLQSDGLATLG